VSTADESRPVREEDAFDVDAMGAWLREHAETFRGDLEGTPEVRQFPGGASNLTYLLRFPRRDLILRRPPAGVKAKSAHDMGREYLIQRALAPVYPYVAQMVGLCTDESVIGSEFYVMERLDGTILRKELPFELSAEEASSLCEHAWEALVRLHSVDVSAVPELAGLGRGDGGSWRRRLGDVALSPAQLLDQQLHWAVTHHMADRVTLLAANGADLSRPLRGGRTSGFGSAPCAHPGG